jgi:hypothetical protein
MTKIKAGLSRETIRLLESAGLDTREKIIEAGEVDWLRIPRFGKRRMDEVNEWLGADAPPVARKVAKCVVYLEAMGYKVIPPNG